MNLINFTLYSSRTGTPLGGALPGGQPNSNPLPSNGNNNTNSNLPSFLENLVPWIGVGGTVALVGIVGVTARKRRRRGV